ncbi:hypothetical protein AB0M91_18570 [Micromonospora rifamycinica]|uniref:hypothetical protein n=1 Tax=Micromonospora rifamycinica TaxID=291594 RepID=UPI00343E7CDB
MLDGLEPLQYPPASVRVGELKDRGLLAMLQNLAFAVEPCLCVVTTRVPVTDLARVAGGLVVSVDLPGLSEAEAESLLRELGVTGHADHLRATGVEYAGHPLALTLLASYLTDRFGGDIRRRDMADPLDDAPDRAGHARRVMQAYGTGSTATAPPGMPASCSACSVSSTVPQRPALRRTPMPGLNDQLVTLSAADYSSVLAVLRWSRLLPPDANHRSALDTHPLVRGHFGQSLRRRAPDAWRQGNKVIDGYLVTTTPATPDTLEGLSPLYSAIYHGVRAGLASEALTKVCRRRILRGDGFFSTRTLGAVGDGLVALSNFFDRPFDRVTATLADQDRAFVLRQAGWCLPRMWSGRLHRIGAAGPSGGVAPGGPTGAGPRRPRPHRPPRPAWRHGPLPG